MNYIGTWGVCQCFEGIDDNEVYEGDRTRFFNMNPNGKVFNCVGEQGIYLVLKYGFEEFKTTKNIYKIIEEPLYKIGDKVRIKKHLMRELY